MRSMGGLKLMPGLNDRWSAMTEDYEDYER